MKKTNGISPSFMHQSKMPIIYYYKVVNSKLEIGFSTN